MRLCRVQKACAEIWQRCQGLRATRAMGGSDDARGRVVEAESVNGRLRGRSRCRCERAECGASSQARWHRWREQDGQPRRPASPPKPPTVTKWRTRSRNWTNSSAPGRRSSRSRRMDSHCPPQTVRIVLSWPVRPIAPDRFGSCPRCGSCAPVTRRSRSCLTSANAA